MKCNDIKSTAIIFLLFCIVGCHRIDITVDTAVNTPQSPTVDSCETFWNSIKHLESDCDFPSLRNDEEMFVFGMTAAANKNDSIADSVFLHLALHSTDTVVRKNAQELIMIHLAERGEWKKLHGAYIKTKYDPSGLSQIMHSAGKEVILAPDTPDTLMVEITNLGVPIVEVVVNGKRKKFWLDTGASEMFLSRDIAEELGVAVIDSITEEVNTATEKIQGSMAVVEYCSIGRSTFKNIPAVVLDEQYMRSRFFGLFPHYSIDGIIGWRIVKHFRMTFNLPQKLIVVEKPGMVHYPQKNFAWLEYPLLKFAALDDDTLLFFFDTGAEQSSAHPNIVQRMPDLQRSGRILSYFGIGGKTVRIGESIDRLTVRSNDNMITFQNISIKEIVRPRFVRIDGVVGNDLLQKGVFVADFPNRYFDFRMTR